MRLVSVTIIALLVAACGGNASGTPSTAAPSAVVDATAGAITSSRSPSMGATSPSASAPLEVADGEAWIAYQGGSSPPPRIRLVRPDGTGDHVLDSAAPTDTAEETPDWSPDGTRLVYVVRGPDTAGVGQDHIEVWMIDADGRHAQQLTDCRPPCQQEAYPAWSPDGTKIAMMRFDGGTDGATHLQVLDLATGVAKDLAYSPDGQVAYHWPRWSPDGRWITFTAETYTDPSEATLVTSRIARIATDGSSDGKPELLTPKTLLAAGSDYAPDGRQLVFGTWTPDTDPPATGSLMLMDAGGSEPTVLTGLDSGGGAALQPTWYPDGSRIQFTYVPSGRGPEAASIRPDGSDLVHLAPSGGSSPLYRTHNRLRPTR